MAYVSGYGPQSPYSGVPSSIGSWVNQRPRAVIPPGGYSLAGTPYDPSTFQGFTPGTAPFTRAPGEGPNPYTAAPSAPSAPARPAINLSNLDFSNDPILSRIRALGQESIAQAEADAKAARTRLVIGYGDQALANKLKLGGKVGKQAAANPFSTLGELQRAYTRRNVFEIDRPLSDQANLFYSTERGRQRALSGEELLRGQSQAEAAVQERLAEISRQVTQARMAAQAQQIQAEQEAYQRALSLAMYAAGT
jgi:hypothetical protein